MLATLFSVFLAVALASRPDAFRDMEAAALASTSIHVENASIPLLRQCEDGINIMAGDIVTMERGGPNFRDLAQGLKGEHPISRVFTKLPTAIIDEYSKGQTTQSTGNIAWTHVGIGIGTNRLGSAYSEEGVMMDEEPCLIQNSEYPGSFSISRYVGKHASEYRELAAHRAKMWEPYLPHYADTAAEWEAAVLGQCLSQTPGERDYFQAVNEERLSEMWEYDESYKPEKGVLSRFANNFRTHDSRGRRVKPKAMFCSKFVAAVWSSVIGNPTSWVWAPPKTDDLLRMFPFRPGGCSPWDLADWLVSKHAGHAWNSCLVKSYGDFGSEGCS